MTDITEVTVEPEGRVQIPASARRATGIEPGMVLILRVEDDHLVLMPRDGIKRELQAMFADVESSMAAELIAERHAEATRDAGAP